MNKKYYNNDGILMTPCQCCGKNPINFHPDNISFKYMCKNCYDFKCKYCNQVTVYPTKKGKVRIFCVDCVKYLESKYKCLNCDGPTQITLNGEIKKYCYVCFNTNKMKNCNICYAESINLTHIKNAGLCCEYCLKYNLIAPSLPVLLKKLYKSEIILEQFDDLWIKHLFGEITSNYYNYFQYDYVCVFTLYKYTGISIEKIIYYIKLYKNINVDENYRISLKKDNGEIITSKAGDFAWVMINYLFIVLDYHGIIKN